LADLDAVGDELHHATDRGDVGTEARGAGAINLDAPLDAGQGTAVFDIAQTLQIFHGRDDEIRRLVQFVRETRGQFELDGLALLRAGIGKGRLRLDAGDVRDARAHVFQDLFGGAALFPVDEAQAD